MLGQPVQVIEQDPKSLSLKLKKLETLPDQGQQHPNPCFPIQQHFVWYLGIQRKQTK